jgi:hypothetical protein
VKFRGDVLPRESTHRGILFEGTEGEFKSMELNAKELDIFVAEHSKGKTDSNWVKEK